MHRSAMPTVPGIVYFEKVSVLTYHVGVLESVPDYSADHVHVDRRGANMGLKYINVPFLEHKCSLRRTRAPLARPMNLFTICIPERMLPSYLDRERSRFFLDRADDVARPSRYLRNSSGQLCDRGTERKCSKKPEDECNCKDEVHRYSKALQPKERQDIVDLMIPNSSSFA
jgi:hypothetical protein